MDCSERSDLPPRANIAFAGLTAAGKTTHAKLLASELGYQYVSATEIFMDVLGMNRTTSRTVWFTQLEAIHALRANDDIDDELERRLIKIASENDGLVLDTWALPWICKIPMVRLWIESDCASRVWKCYLSQDDRLKPFHDLSDCQALIDKKDGETRDIFMRRHQFDLFRDHDVFDIILDNTHLITAPTREAANRGIASFAPVVLQACRHILGAGGNSSESILADLTPWRRACVLKLGRA